MKKILHNEAHDEERAMYNLCDAEVINCTFAGPADGESALKECRNIKVKDSSFSLRYPLWHAENYIIENSTMDGLTRAALWYCRNGEIKNSSLHGIKALRECDDSRIYGCEVISPEFGWRCRKVTFDDCNIDSEYFMFESKDLSLNKVKMKGKYSFQYVENAVICDSDFDTKDAFWHSKNVTVKNSVLKGEYLAWYSEGLTLINCLIIGTQPLCYCKNLTLINCRTEGCDLAFEYSDVNATIEGNVVSIKNPKSGLITVDSVGEIIKGDNVVPCQGEVIVKHN